MNDNSPRRCKDFGHKFRVLRGDRESGMERCVECGYEKVFYYNDSKTYAKEHRRDFLQPNEKGFEAVYEKIINTPKEKKHSKEEISRDARDTWKWFKQNYNKFSSNQLKSGEWVNFAPKQ